MKILKPGKVEQRKFVCEKCGCIFAANENDMIGMADADIVCCPTCEISHRWCNGEPYEEPTPTQDDRERLKEVIAKYFDIGDSYCYHLTRVKSAFAVGTMSLDDFTEFDDETVDDLTSYLLKHGVTFRVV